MTDEAERQRAWRRYHDIRGYAESTMCRHVAICRHFGEPVPSRICGMCDVCGPAPEWYEQSYDKAQRAEAIGPSAPARKPHREKIAVPAAAAAPGSEAVFAKLRAWRLEVARRQKLPPYVIFHDSVLRSIAAIRPADLDTLAGISGLGPAKLERYGAEVLKALEDSDS